MTGVLIREEEGRGEGRGGGETPGICVHTKKTT